jgi:hypothetical protein
MRQDIERLTYARDAGYSGATLFKYKGDQFARICIILYHEQTQVVERASAFEFDRVGVCFNRVFRVACFRFIKY